MDYGTLQVMILESKMSFCQMSRKRHARNYLGFTSHWFFRFIVLGNTCTLKFITLCLRRKVFVSQNKAFRIQKAAMLKT